MTKPHEAIEIMQLNKALREMEERELRGECRSCGIPLPPGEEHIEMYGSSCVSCFEELQTGILRDNYEYRDLVPEEEKKSSGWDDS